MSSVILRPTQPWGNVVQLGNKTYPGPLLRRRVGDLGVGRQVFSPATTAWLTAIETADNTAGFLGPMNNGVWNAKGILADAFAILCPTGTLVFGDGARSLTGALIRAQGAVPVGVNLVAGDWNGRSFGLSPTGGKHINTTLDNITLPQNDRHFSVVSAGGSGVHTATAFLIGGNAANGGIHLIRSAGDTISSRMASTAVNLATVAPNPFLFPVGTYGLFRNNSANFTTLLENVATVRTITSQAPISQTMRVGAAGAGANGLDVRIRGYTLGTYVDPIVLRDLLNTAIDSITAALA